MTRKSDVEAVWAELDPIVTATVAAASTFIPDEES
jgi:hypothetical protein